MARSLVSLTFVVVLMAALEGCAMGDVKSATTAGDPPPIELLVEDVLHKGEVVGCIVKPKGGNLRLTVKPKKPRSIIWKSTTDEFQISFNPLTDENAEFGEMVGRAGTWEPSTPNPVPPGHFYKLDLTSDPSVPSGTYATKYAIKCKSGHEFDPVVIVDR